MSELIVLELDFALHSFKITAMGRKRIEGFLLDVDGTLIDSNDAHAKAWMDALKEFKIEVDFQKIRTSIGMGGDNLLPVVAQMSKDSSLGQKIDQARSQIFINDYLPHLKAFPSAQQLLLEMKKLQFQTVIASSASREDLKALLHQCHLEGLVDDQTTSSDAEHSKPNPDIIEAAIEKSGLSPHSLVMVGDTPYDIDAAKRAHVKCIGFTCGGWKKAELADADWSFEGPHDLLRALKENPDFMN